MIDWKEWYFDRARERAEQDAHDLFWKHIKPGCSQKMLAQVAKHVLDIDDPHAVDWRFLRPAHVFLRQDQLDKRTLNGAMANIKRIAMKHGQRRIHPWFLEQMGWRQKRYNPLKEISILTEDEYSTIESSVINGLPADAGTAIKTMLRLMYYGGLTVRQVTTLRAHDIIQVDGRMLLYSKTMLVELPDHIRLPLASWLRLRAEKKGRGGRKPKRDGTERLFKSEQSRIVAKFPRLNDTFRSIERLRG